MPSLCFCPWGRMVYPGPLCWRLRGSRERELGQDLLDLHPQLLRDLILFPGLLSQVPQLSALKPFSHAVIARDIFPRLENIWNISCLIVHPELTTGVLTDPDNVARA